MQSVTAQDQGWPPLLPGAVNGTVSFTSDLLLQIPTSVEKLMAEPGAVPFIMAVTPPTVDLAFHSSLPDRAVNGVGWCAMGDIALAGDGTVYCGIGDHGDDAGSKSHAFLYRWDPSIRVLEQVVDLNTIVPRANSEPTWAKLHARIDEGSDGNIYFTGTLNDGDTAGQPQFKWSKVIPGGQLYRYDPKTGQASLITHLPAGRCTATAMLDRRRNIWWCNLEAGPNGLWAFDLTTKRELYRAPAGSVTFNRHFALDRKGIVYFNGKDGIWKCDARAKSIAPMTSSFGTEAGSGMRASTDESRDGWIYGCTAETYRLFRFAPATDTLELLGPTFCTGEYTTVCVLSPDQQYLYYLPGSHGEAFNDGPPVIQYHIHTRRQKVLAFLRKPLETLFHYVPGGTYGVKISPDGGTLYVNLNGHAADDTRPPDMGAVGYGLTSFLAIHIPASER